MSLIVKTNPVGVDSLINSFQTDQFEELGLTGHVSFPRVYMNEKEINGKSGYIPEYFKSGKDYLENFFDDTVPITTFFYQHPRTPLQNQLGTARVSQITMALLDKVFPSAPHRFDGELKEMFEAFGFKWLGSGRFELVDSFTTRDEVFRDFLFEHLKYDDMHPFFVMRQEYLVRYVPSEQC